MAEKSLTVRALSSTGGFYEVVFTIRENRLFLLCECEAAKNVMWCKHRSSVIARDVKALFDPGDISILDEALAWPELEAARSQISNAANRISELEAQKKALSSEQKQIKITLARTLGFGLEL